MFNVGVGKLTANYVPDIVSCFPIVLALLLLLLFKFWLRTLIEGRREREGVRDSVPCGEST